MYLEAYPYEIYEDLLAFEFISIGPRGHIRKIVRFFHFGNNTYNLEFGDFDVIDGAINDTIVTNNNDTKKVLTTVARIVFDFTSFFPNAKVAAKGSTHSRTRLYRMGITNSLSLISSEYMIYGYLSERWEFFERGKDYEAFLVHLK